MFREMRRKRQKLTDEQTYEIIRSTADCVMGVIGDGGYPYTVPVNHVLVGNKLYFHSAKDGHKIDAIKNDPKVSFTFTEKNDVMSREFTTYFRSAQIFGKAYIVEDEDERQKAFKALCEKFCSSDMDRYEEIMSKEAKDALIVCAEIEMACGKEAIELVKKRG